MPDTAVVKGLVLAGGSSRRMGADKAAVNFAGQPLLDRAVAALATCVDEVFVAARNAQQDEAVRSRHACIVDSPMTRGPAAGILAAHALSPASAWFVLACDMPLLDGKMLAQLLARRNPDCAATAWLTAEGSDPEPLCTVYEPATLAAFTHFVTAGGDPSPRHWLRQQSLQLLSRPPGKALTGANTPQELDDLASCAADQQNNRNANE